PDHVKAVEGHDDRSARAPPIVRPDRKPLDHDCITDAHVRGGEPSGLVKAEGTGYGKDLNVIDHHHKVGTRRGDRGHGEEDHQAKTEAGRGAHNHSEVPPTHRRLVLAAAPSIPPRGASCVRLPFGTPLLWPLPWPGCPVSGHAHC